MKPIRIDKFYQGQQESKYFKGIAETYNLEVFEVPGQARCANGWTTVTNRTGTFCAEYDSRQMPYIYLFAGTELFKYYLSGSNTKLHDTSEDTINAIQYKTDVYYIGHTTLYKTNGSTESTVGTLLHDAFTYNAPMLVHGLDLYIGNKNVIASVDASGTYSDNVLDLPENYFINDIASFGTDIIVVGEKLDGTGFVLRYDTYSESFYGEDLLDERVYSVMSNADDSILFCVVGDDADLYYYNGDKLDYYKPTNGAYNKEKLYKKHVQNNKGVIFSGDRYGDISVLKRGVRGETFGYTTGMKSNNGDVTHMDTVDQYVVIATYNGIYKHYGKFLSSANEAYQTAHLITSITSGKIDSISVGCADLPTGTQQVNIYTKEKETDNWVQQETVTDDKDKREVRTTSAIHNTRDIQVKIELVPSTSGEETPIIEYIDII